METPTASTGRLVGGSLPSNGAVATATQTQPTSYLDSLIWQVQTTMGKAHSNELWQDCRDSSTVVESSDFAQVDNSSHSCSAEISSTSSTKNFWGVPQQTVTNSENKMDLAWDKRDHLADRGMPSLLRLPSMPLNGEGLASLSQETLWRYMQPIAKALERLDAEPLLDLQRVEQGGARISDTVRVKPIHNDVTPPQQRNGSCVRYLHVSEVPDKYSIGIFVFPPHARIPLHDHPGMCVLSRILYGSLERVSLDLMREDDAVDMSVDMEPMDIENEKDYDHQWSSSNSWFSRWPSLRSSHSMRKKEKLPEGSRRALYNGSEHLQAPDVTVLYPYEGNLHEFIAGPEGAAVLDVLLPPYDLDHHRECTFYTVHEDTSELTMKQPCWIIPTGQPEDFHCLSGCYLDLGGEDSDDDDLTT